MSLILTIYSFYTFATNNQTKQCVPKIGLYISYILGLIYVLSNLLNQTSIIFFKNYTFYNYSKNILTTNNNSNYSNLDQWTIIIFMSYKFLLLLYFNTEIVYFTATTFCNNMSRCCFIVEKLVLIHGQNI